MKRGEEKKPQFSFEHPKQSTNLQVWDGGLVKIEPGGA